eukprot:TRINITY_DN78721_c0_g1_i1.p1 TRINITY_DN78721_c0_g1~~TRINITY_DN78721_c0_g1_i1.p1  ORF type:complete len:267 (+),score=49.94 TRINITY_DN78721_c0_g1_i1:3-803(+)
MPSWSLPPELADGVDLAVSVRGVGGPFAGESLAVTAEPIILSVYSQAAARSREARGTSRRQGYLDGLVETVFAGKGGEPVDENGLIKTTFTNTDGDLVYQIVRGTTPDKAPQTQIFSDEFAAVVTQFTEHGQDNGVAINYTSCSSGLTNRQFHSGELTSIVDFAVLNEYVAALGGSNSGVVIWNRHSGALMLNMSEVTAHGGTATSLTLGYNVPVVKEGENDSYGLDANSSQLLLAVGDDQGHVITYILELERLEDSGKCPNGTTT